MAFVFEAAMVAGDLARRWPADAVLADPLDPLPWVSLQHWSTPGAIIASRLDPATQLAGR